MYQLLYNYLFTFDSKLMPKAQINMNGLPEKSILKLNGVHPDLSKLIIACSREIGSEFIVTEGLRTLERQKALLKEGATRTLKSRHLTGHAVDLAVLIDNEIRWDWPLYKVLADQVKKVAAKMKIQIVWGGDWKTFKDGPHFQLDRQFYP